MPESSATTMHPTASPDAQSSTFSSVPVLDYSLISSPSTKPLFISQLQHALINIGFLYLSNHTITIDPLIDHIPKLFALPQEEKEKIRMVNSPHFLGYSELDTEQTKGKVDHKAQFVFATGHETRWREGEEEAVPEYWKQWGPPQWPDESVLPGFRAVLERYLIQVQDLAHTFISLVAESLSLPPDALGRFYDTEENMQHRARLIKYPAVVVTDPANDQGAGPHYDSGFLTFLLQASPHKGLQVQNLTGEWIDVPPVPGTFVVNIGKALEFVTQGLARATSHRVLSPRGAVGPRYSVPFFQSIRLDIRLADNVLDFPPDVLKLKEGRGVVGATESVNYSELDREPSGQVELIARVKSHPDVAERHYPQMFKKYFPEGLPSVGMGY